MKKSDLEEAREALQRWIEAARATYQHDEEFAETLEKTPFYGLVMSEEAPETVCQHCGQKLPNCGCSNA